jgi:hypothetical protein
MGGDIWVGGDPVSGIVVRMSGARAAWPAHFAGWIADPDVAWAALESMARETARGMQGPLTVLVAADCGIRLSHLMARDAEGAPPLILSPVN